MTEKKFGVSITAMWRKESQYGEYFTSAKISPEMIESLKAAPEGSYLVLRPVKEGSRRAESSPTHYLDIREPKEGNTKF